MWIAGLMTAAALAHGGGRVLVDNESGTTVTVDVAGVESRVLAPGQEAWFTVPYGEARVRATYVQFGRDRALEAERIVVRPHDTAYVRLDRATTTRLRVVNDTWLAGDLFADGAWVAHLEPGAREVVKLPVGVADLELRDARGRVLDRERRTARAYAEDTWTADAPRTGAVVVDNDNGIPLVVEVDGRWAASIDPWSEARVEVPVGCHTIAVFDARGRPVESRFVDVDPWDVARIDVDGPERPPAPAPGHAHHAGCAHGDALATHDDWEREHHRR